MKLHLGGNIMKQIKWWKRYISTILAVAMLITNFTPSLSTIFAEGEGNHEVNVEEVETVVRLDSESTLEDGGEQSNEDKKMEVTEPELVPNVTGKEEMVSGDETTEATHTLIIHYNRAKGDYNDWDVWLWEEGSNATAMDFSKSDDFGKVVTLTLKSGRKYGYIIRKNDWTDKNHASDQFIMITENKEIWVEQGQDGYHETKPDLGGGDQTPLELVVHYERSNQDYDNFNLYSWGSQNPQLDSFKYQDEYGMTNLFSFESLQDLKNFGFIIYQQVDGQEWYDNKEGNDKTGFDLEQLNLIKNVDQYVSHVYVKQGSDDIYYTNPNKEISDYSIVTVHYNRQNQDYNGWNLWTWGTGSEDGQQSFEYQDEYGMIAQFKVKTGNTLGYLIRKGDWEEKNYDADQSLLVLVDTEIWVNQGQNGFDAMGPNGNRVEVEEDPFEDLVSDEEAEMQIFIHYYRYLEDYKNWNVWAWAEGQEGYGYPFTSSDDFGKVSKINLKDLGETTQLGFLIRKGDWSAQDINKDRFIDLTKATELNGKKVLHVYLLQGEEMIYFQPDVDKTPALSAATFTDVNALKFSAPVSFEDTEGIKVLDAMGNELNLSNASLSKDKRWIHVILAEEIEVGETYYVSKEQFRAPVIIEYYGIFDSKAFNDKFYYEGSDLGSHYTNQKTTFKVWAPTASTVSLQLYRTGHESDLYQETDMIKGEKGVWELEVQGDLNNVYYTYKVTVGNDTQIAVDPYARSVGVNGNRGMVVDLNSTDPSNWSKDTSPEFSGNMTDAIIYELHLRDLSSAENSGIENVGKFLQLTETGTVSDKGVATGLDHIKEMGITHLHLLPAFDHRSINETKLNEAQFNWGYDPQHYNAPEGSYSTDPYHGEVRVNEFKQMVQSLHTNGIRVVMDVVYNHTGATMDSDFNKIVPGYYYRQNEDGTFSNGSGTGNETASERLMMRKFMIDSVKYWATEYNIDGFRFDLMALHDVETMNDIEAALHEIDPSIIIYGEGWTGGGTPLPDSEAAYKGNAKQTPNIAYFNDDMRDAVKGNVGNDWEPGFINGNTSDYFYNRLKFGIVGSSYHDQVTGWNFWAANPTQSISYVSAHDNNTLYDKLLGVETAKGADGNTSEEYLKTLQKQANAIVLTGQGVPFLHAGVEMMRSKDGDHNSYNKPDEINQIDWDLKYENYDVVNYYKGLIELRKSNAAFRMIESTDVNQNLRFDDNVPNGVVSFSLESKEEYAEQIAVIHNVTSESQTVQLPVSGEWSVVVNGEEAGIETLEIVTGDEVSVTPHSSFVLMLNYDQPVSNKSQLSDVLVTVDGEEIQLTPAFMPYIYNYSLTIPSTGSRIGISGFALQSGSTIKGINIEFSNGSSKVKTDANFSGTIDFPIDQKEMTIKLTVSSESQEKESTYTFKVTRESGDPDDQPGENQPDDEEPTPTPNPPVDNENLGNNSGTNQPTPISTSNSTYKGQNPQTGWNELSLYVGIGCLLLISGGVFIFQRNKKRVK